MKEKSAQKVVLIAMTGGIESTVAAYLLKKQGYKCIGIGMECFSDGLEPGPFRDVAILDPNKIKNICDYLDMPFYVVNASDIFSDKILDPLVGRVLSGQTFEPLVFLNTLLFDILLEKAAKFQTNLIASAHYAKVLKNQKTGAFEIFVANDLEHDQSYSLSNLEQKHLENLILPLSEIRKKEVEKISELIKVEFIPRIKSKFDHIMHDPRMAQLVEVRAPKDLKKTGSFFDYSTDTSIGEHEGIHHYYVGQSNLILDKKNKNLIDPLKQIISIASYKGNIFIDYPDKLKYQHVHIVEFYPSANLDMSTPLTCYIKISPKGEKTQCRLHFKNNAQALVEFDTPRPGLLVPGQFVVFYNRHGEKGKILGAAIVETAGVFSEFSYNTLPKKSQEKEEEEEDEAYDQSSNNISRMQF